MPAPCAAADRATPRRFFRPFKKRGLARQREDNGDDRRSRKAVLGLRPHFGRSSSQFHFAESCRQLMRAFGRPKRRVGRRLWRAWRSSAWSVLNLAWRPPRRGQLGKVAVWRKASPSASAADVARFIERTCGRIGMRTRASQASAITVGTPALSFPKSRTSSAMKPKS